MLSRLPPLLVLVASTAFACYAASAAGGSDGSPVALREPPAVLDVVGTAWAGDELVVAWRSAFLDETTGESTPQLGLSWFSPAGDWLRGWVISSSGRLAHGASVATDDRTLGFFWDEPDAEALGEAVRVAWMPADGSSPPTLDTLHSWRGYPDDLPPGCLSSAAAASDRSGFALALTWHTCPFVCDFVGCPTTVYSSGMVLAPRAAADLHDLWRPATGHWPDSSTVPLATDSGFLGVWTEWGGIHGPRLVAAPLSAAGAGEPVHALWEGAAPIWLVAAVRIGDRPAVVWEDLESRSYPPSPLAQLTVRRLRADGAPDGPALLLGTLPALMCGGLLQTSAAADGSNLLVLHDSSDDSCPETLLCYGLDGTSGGIASPSAPEVGGRSILAAPGPSLALVRSPGRDDLPGPVRVTPVHCSPGTTPLPARSEATPSATPVTDLGFGQFRFPRLAWNGSSFVVVALVGQDPEVTSIGIAADGSPIGPWSTFGGSRYDSTAPAVAVAPGGQTLVAWTDARNGSVMALAIGPGGSPAGLPRTVGNSASSAPALALGPRGAFAAWMSWSTDSDACDPFVVRLSPSLEPLASLPLSTSSPSCRATRWAPAAMTSPEHDYVLWAADREPGWGPTELHVTALDDAGVVSDRTLVGESSLEVLESLPEVIDGFQTPVALGEASWLLPAIGNSAPWDDESQRGPNAILVDAHAGTARRTFLPPGAPDFRYGCSSADISGSVVDAGGTLFGAFPSLVENGTESMLAVHRIVDGIAAGEGLHLAGRAPTIHAVSAAWAGDRLGIVWTEAGRSVGEPGVGIRFTVIPAADLPADD
ncbi:MAG: hypothetical protein HY905_26595 [Deltaproteobacteria bacterium]|nr:hypothetical protein [Deltaproteobacteria bacterium]